MCRHFFEGLQPCPPHMVIIQCAELYRVVRRYRDRTTTVAAARALAGSQLLGEMLTVGLPVPLREGE